MNEDMNRMEPFTFRLPKTGSVDPFFGGSRTFWNEKILPSKNNGSPQVDSIIIAVPGAKRGIRFILFESAKRFFERIAKEQK
jgi:hypothetical protein